MKDRPAFADMSLPLSRVIARSSLRLAPLAWLVAAGTARGGRDIAVTDAWTPPNVEVGSDAVLGMVVTNDGADGCSRACFVSSIQLFREAPNRHWRGREVGASNPRHSNRREIETRIEPRRVPRRSVANSPKTRARRRIPVLGFVSPIGDDPSSGARAATGPGP